LIYLKKKRESTGLVGKFNNVSKAVVALGNKKGFTKLSLVVVPLCLLASILFNKEDIKHLLGKSTDTTSEYVYTLSEAVGQVKGSYVYGEQAGYEKAKKNTNTSRNR